MRCKFLLGTLKVGLNKHGQILNSSGVILASRLSQRHKSNSSEYGFWKRNVLSRSILDINKKCILFHTKINFVSGTKSYAWVHHTFSTWVHNTFSVKINLVLYPLYGGCSYKSPGGCSYVPGTRKFIQTFRSRIIRFPNWKDWPFSTRYKWFSGSQKPIKAHKVEARTRLKVINSIFQISGNITWKRPKYIYIYICIYIYK